MKLKYEECKPETKFCFLKKKNLLSKLSCRGEHYKALTSLIEYVKLLAKQL